MAGNRTLTIIKPDAFASGKAGKIIAHLEGQGFKRRRGARHAPHRGAGGGVLRGAQGAPVLRVAHGVHDLGHLHADGAREGGRRGGAARRRSARPIPRRRTPGTVRKLYAESKERNAIHASDSDENAAREAAFFFAEADLLAAR